MDWLYTIIVFLILLCIGQISKSTYDSGDSITHFLYDKYAIQEPRFFLNLWAKPICVLLSSPFAYSGFNGMKIFQAIINAFAFYFTIKTSRLLHLKFPLLSGIFILCMPKFILSTASGLTEPLFASWLIASTYFMIKGEKAIATILFSFLLFVRQEGMIVDIIVVIYLLASKNWKYIFLLPAAIIAFGFIGFPFYHQFLWYFTQNPYNHPPGQYGYGNGWAFLNMYLIFTGNILGVISLIGLIQIIVLFLGRYFKRQNVFYINERFFLLSGIIVGFVTFHAIACSFGLFGSDCMIRVLICILPPASILSLEGFLVIYRYAFNRKIKLVRKLPVLLVCIIILFPFSGLPTTYNFPGDFKPGNDMIEMDSAANWIKSEHLHNEVFFSAPCGALSFKSANILDNHSHEFTIWYEPVTFPKGSIYIWDSWYSVTERKVILNDLVSKGAFSELKKFSKSGNATSPDIVVLLKN